jgi:hypothetical protein
LIDPFYEFEWPVAHAYQWQDWRDAKGNPVVVLARGYHSRESALAIESAWKRREEGKAPTSGPVLAPVVNGGEEVWRYRPMHREHATLFQEFSKLDHRSRTAIADFASRYGLLGVRQVAQTLAYRGEDGLSHPHYAAGEPLLDWALEICLMKEAIHLSGIKRSRDDDHRLSWLFDRNLQRVQGRISLEGPKGPVLRLTPLDLLAAMWLQFSLAIAGDKRFVACRHCQRLFEISTDPTGFRSHREFCSGSCKTLDYRKRKRTALELAGSGAGLADISEQTGTERTTVRGWLASAKRQGRSLATEKA